MNTQPTHRSNRLLKTLGVLALEVLGLAACDDTGTNPVIIGEPPADEVLVSAQISVEHAAAGDTVLVEWELSVSGERRETLFATVEWDERRFEYLGVLAADAEAILEGKADNGLMQLRLDNRNGFNGAELVIAFRARIETDTDGFALSDVRGVAADRDGENQRDVA